MVLRIGVFLREGAPDLRDPTSRVAFLAALLRDDALKWWRQTKTSGTVEENDFDRFKAQLCSCFLTTDPVKDAKDQLAELKQIKSAEAWGVTMEVDTLNQEKIPKLAPEVRRR